MLNTQIEKLANQAKQYAREQMAHSMDPLIFSASVFQQKFAELIIQECVQMFAENGYDESCDMLIEHWDIDPRTFRS